MQSINIFSTYGKLQLNVSTIPTSKNTELVRSLFGTCWEPVGNRLAGSFSIVTGPVHFLGFLALAHVQSQLFVPNAPPRTKN